MINVKKVNYFDQYKLYIELSNGISGYFDVSPYIDKGIFSQLKDIDYLKCVKPDTFGICWSKGQDFSADTIAYELQAEN